MILFDLILLVIVSGLLAVKSLYLGAVTLVIGFLIGFQARRTLHLLGFEPAPVPVSRRVRAGILALIIALTLFPLALERVNTGDQFEKIWSQETLLPILVLLGLFTAAMMSALAIEKRKR